jgi:hypothetical protein
MKSYSCNIFRKKNERKISISNKALKNKNKQNPGAQRFGFIRYKVGSRNLIFVTGISDQPT